VEGAGNAGVVGLMGLRDRLKGAVKSALGVGAPGPTPTGRTTPGALPAAPAPDGSRAVGFSTQVGEGRAATWAHEGQVVAVFRLQGRLYAIDNACAHEDGPVGEGAVAGDRVRCPYHDWEYEFTTGRCLTDPTRRLATWRVREEGGVIWMGSPLTPGTGDRGGDHNDGLEVIRR
jgi:nitrite reductase/ring-hydroxylating ferredoxin subunit